MVDLQERLNRLSAQAMKEMTVIGLPFVVPVKWEVKRGTSNWGICHRSKNPITGKYDYTIRISKCTLDSRVSDDEVKNVIIHELIHTIPDCFDHKSDFKKWAGLVNDCYACYHIKRSESASEKGISNEVLNEYKPKRNYNYRFRCACCGREYKYTRITNCYKEIKRYGKAISYRCSGCGSDDLRITY